MAEDHKGGWRVESSAIAKVSTVRLWPSLMVLVVLLCLALVALLALERIACKAPNLQSNPASPSKHKQWQALPQTLQPPQDPQCPIREGDPEYTTSYGMPAWFTVFCFFILL